MGGFDGTHGRGRLVGGLLAGLLLLAGCGGSGSAASSGEAATRPAPAVNRTGVKAEEARTALHLSRRDCDLLGAAATKQTGRTVHISADSRPPLSGCRLGGHGVHLTITLDTSYGAHQRYFNRVTETQQFGAPDPEKMPHPVPGVGEPGAYGQSAEWIPGLGTLLAVRGNRWLTISYAAAGEPRPARKVAAAALARRAFRLSAR